MIWFYLQPAPQHSTTIQASRMQVQALKTELELKTKVLLMPVDACVRHAMHGNTVRLMCCHVDHIRFAAVGPDASNIESGNHLNRHYSRDSICMANNMQQDAVMYRYCRAQWRS